MHGRNSTNSNSVANLLSLLHILIASRGFVWEPPKYNVSRLLMKAHSSSGNSCFIEILAFIDFGRNSVQCVSKVVMQEEIMETE